MRSSSSLAQSKIDLSCLPELTLYGDLNMRPFRSAWMLQELQLPYKHIRCKPWSRVAKSVHPLGKVPALLVEYPSTDEKSDDSLDSSSFVVLESAAINTFLGDLSREHDNCNNNESRRPTLVPPPATQERAKYDSLVSFIMTEIDFQSLWIHRKHSDLANVFGEVPVVVNKAKRQFNNALQVMEDEIHFNGEKCTYLLPSGFSGADILFANCCFWAQQNYWIERKVMCYLVMKATNQSCLFLIWEVK
jgi:glutathione S-transferase